MTRVALLFAALTVAFAAPSVAGAQSLRDAVLAAQRARAQVEQSRPLPEPAPRQETARQRQPEQARPPEMVREVSLGSVISNIQQRTPGRMLDAGRSSSGGRPTLKVLWGASDGRRIEYTVDAQTGSILSANGG